MPPATGCAPAGIVIPAAAAATAGACAFSNWRRESDMFSPISASLSTCSNTMFGRQDALPGCYFAEMRSKNATGERFYDDDNLRSVGMTNFNVVKRGERT